MKKRIFTLTTLILAVFTLNTLAQSEATSPRMSFNITKEVKPPLWQIVEEPYFVDDDGNKAIDANETCKILMKLKNVGTGDGMGLTAKISATGNTAGINYSNQKISNIPVGGTATVTFPITTNMNTEDGNVSFEVFVDEPMGFSTNKYTLKVNTRAFRAPMIEVKDYEATCEGGGKLEKMKPFQLRLLIQNTQYGLGENVKVTLKYPDKVFNAGGQDVIDIPQLSAGEAIEITYTLLVNNQYAGISLPLQVQIKEKYGKYAQNKNITLELNQPLVNRVDIKPIINPEPVIADLQLRSEVDRNIPQTGKDNRHRYALVIGNEDYHSYQNDLNSEQDVPFALSDANIFKQYCVKTLGVEEKNLVFLSNATAAMMNRQIVFITQLAEIDPQAEIIFYYAGHGFPDENTKEPYLIPVDVNASSLNSAIPLYSLYNKLCNTGAKRVTVFLDACFSGGGRGTDLVASRGIKVTPKKDALTGNLVVFSATSADQTAYPYREKTHGLFTYFLLKKLQDSNGECTYSELLEYLKNNVLEISLRTNGKRQTPEVNTAPQVQDSWKSWHF